MNEHMNEPKQALCTNVFKNDDPSDRKRQLTLRWIEAINRTEKNNKSVSDNSGCDEPFSV